MNFDIEFSTFSIVAYDPKNGDLGVGVQSKSFNVGSVVPWAEAKVGAIATQALTNASYGPKGLKLLKEGLSIDNVLQLLIEKDKDRNKRQLGIIDAKGYSSSFTGSDCTQWAGSKQGPNYSVQGNTVESEEVVVAMAEAFESVQGELAERLMASLEAGQNAGGDARGKQSASLLVVREGMGRAFYGDRYIDLRIEDHRTPIIELRRLFNMNQSYRYIMESHELMNEGKIYDALELALRAVELSQENDIAHLTLCKATFLTGNRTLAIEEFKEAVRLNNKIHFYIKRHARAREQWKLLLENDCFNNIL